MQTHFAIHNEDNNETILCLLCDSFVKFQITIGYICQIGVNIPNKDPKLKYADRSTIKLKFIVFKHDLISLCNN